MHSFEAEVLRKSPGHEIENTCDTRLSIAHAAPPDVSLPAVSSIGGLRTPAPECAAPPPWGRHPKTFTTTEVATLPRSPCNDPEGRTCHKIAAVLRCAANRNARRKWFDHRT